MGELWHFVQSLRDWFPQNFGTDVLKSLLGTLIGAGLAFWFALRKDALTRLREQRASGNAAITTLVRMASDYVQARFAIADHRDRVLAEQPSLPVWMQILPMPFKHSENLHFDIKGLTFIFDNPQGPDVFNVIMNAEIKYHSFFHLLAEHRKFAEDVQNLLAEHHPDPHQPLPVRDLVATLGFAKVHRLESLTKGIFSYVDDETNVYEQGLEVLPKLLKAIFKKGVVRASFPSPEQLKRAIVT